MKPVVAFAALFAATILVVPTVSQAALPVPVAIAQ